MHINVWLCVILILLTKLLPYYLKRTQTMRAAHDAAQMSQPASHPVEIPAVVNSSSDAHFTPLRSRANRLGRTAVPSRTADEILGFARPTAMHNNLENGLDSEIDAYFLDTNVGTSSLAYWQV
jgi:hypothetical protein